MFNFFNFIRHAIISFKFLFKWRCKNLRQSLHLFNTTTKKSILSLKYFARNNEKLLITFLPAKKQPHGQSCILFATAYAAENLEGNSPTEAVFTVREMRGHLIKCLEKPKIDSCSKSLKHKVSFVILSQLNLSALSFLMFKNDQTYYENLAGFTPQDF